MKQFGIDFINENIQIDLQNFIASLICVTILSLLIQLFYIRFSSTLSNRIQFSKNFVILGVATCIVISFMQNPPIALQKIQATEHIFDDSGRDKIREFSYYAFKTNPLLGVGFGNFSQVEMDDIKDAVLKDKEVFDNNLYVRSSHAHNVYFTYLVSGGLLIFSIFVWFWFYILWIIIKHVILNNLRIYRNKFPENEWIVLSGISVVLVNLGIGWVNTTLHHEHAILSMFVLGLLIAQFRKTELIEELTV